MGRRARLVQNAAVRALLAVVLMSGVGHAETRTAITLDAALVAADRAPAAKIHGYEVEAAESSYAAASAWPSPTVHVGTNRLTARLVGGLTVPLPLFGTVGAARQVA